MFKQLKAVTTAGAITLAMFSAAPALAESSSAFPSSAREFSSVDDARTTPATNVMHQDMHRTPNTTTSAFPSSAREFSMIDQPLSEDKMTNVDKMMSSAFPSAARE